VIVASCPLPVVGLARNWQLATNISAFIFELFIYAKNQLFKKTF